MTTWKVCVYLSDDERIGHVIDVVEPREVVPKDLEDELDGFRTRPYSDMIDAGWIKYKPPMDARYSLSASNHPRKKFLQKEMED